MIFPAATPKPFQGTTTRGEENLIPQPQETGQVVPVGHNGSTATVTEDGPKVKPWAHFVAGGYARTEVLGYWMNTDNV
jgi:hypothetical protein